MSTTIPSASNIGTIGLIEIQSLQQLLDKSATLQPLTSVEITNINNELENRKNLQMNQIREIEEKEKLLLTRARMLQISQDRNSYKKKIIYTLIAVIFGIFILTLVIYVLFVRKIAMIKNK